MGTVIASTSLPRSVTTLAELAVRHVNAEGYALYEIHAPSGDLVLRAACGSPLPTPKPRTELGAQNWEVGGALSFPLFIEGDFVGLVAFALQDRSLTPAKRQILERTARILEVLLGLFRAVETQTQLAARISELEADLADEKIADRAKGLLDTDNLHGDAIDVIERHVGKVLGTRSFGQILVDLRRELENRVTERSLTAQAKTVLQVEHGMSEQQAYLHLRMASRRTRKRIGDVAQQIIENRETSRGHA